MPHQDDVNTGGLDSEAYRALFTHALEGVLFTAPDGTIVAANPAACEMLGWTEEQLRVLGRAAVADPADSKRWQAGIAQRKALGWFKGELSFLRSDGTAFPADVSSNVFEARTGELRTGVMFRDATERKGAEEELRALALIDDLTGLHNRRAFLHLADQAFREAQRSGHPIVGGSPGIQ